MSYAITLDWTGAPGFAEYAQYADLNLLSAMFENLIGEDDAIAVTLEFTTDATFVETVQAAFNSRGWGDHGTFSPARLGGQVVAKNISMTPDHGTVTIVFDVQTAVEKQEHQALKVASFVSLLIHELVHPILTRRRHLNSPAETLNTPELIARSIVEIAADEYRCDIISARALPRLLTAEGANGEPIALTAGMLYEDDYWQQLSSALETRFNNGWDADKRSYQTYQMSLEELVNMVYRETDQALTLASHAQALADADPALSPDPFSGTNGTQPGATNYLKPAWQAIGETLRGQEVLPTSDQFAVTEAALHAVGVPAILAMWARLGLTFSNFQPDGGYEIHVS